MKNVFVVTRNVKAFIETIDNLESRADGVPGMALVWGQRGLGKTRSALFLAGKRNMIYVRAKRIWGDPSWLLEALCIELGIIPANRKKQLFSDLTTSLKASPRTLIIDECNLPSQSIIDTIRDIHDETETPIVMMGHEGIEQRLKRMGPLYDRLLYITEFKKLNEDDIAEFAKKNVEIGVSDAALKRISSVVDGNFRKTVTLFCGGERRAMNLKAGEIAVEHLAGGRR